MVMGVLSGLTRPLAVSGGSPAPRERDHACLMIGPVVKGGRVKVGAVRPNERVNLAID